MLIFFDTEFTGLHSDARLISIGLITEDGERIFYAELSDTYQTKDCGDFTKMTVLPLLDGGESALTMRELTQRIGAWLADFGEPITLACDSLAWDWPWIQEIFRDPSLWPVNLAHKPLLLTVGCRAPLRSLASCLAVLASLRDRARQRFIENRSIWIFQSKPNPQPHCPSNIELSWI